MLIDLFACALDLPTHCQTNVLVGNVSPREAYANVYVCDYARYWTGSLNIKLHRSL